MGAEARTKAPPKSRSRGAMRTELPRYDQALRNAKNERKRVCLHLDYEADFTNAEHCTVIGNVAEVDKFDIALVVVSPDHGYAGRIIWIKKSHIVATEVL